MEILDYASVVFCILLIVFLAIVTFMSFLTKLDSEKLEKSFVMLCLLSLSTTVAFLFPNEMINLLKLVTFIGPIAISIFFIMVLYCGGDDSRSVDMKAEVLLIGTFYVPFILVAFSELEVTSLSFLKLISWALLHIIIWLCGFIIIKN